MADIVVHKVDEVFVKLTSDDKGILQHLAESFTFFVPEARFSPSYKSKLWDGKIRLLNSYTGLLYLGLVTRLESIAKTFEYTIEFSYEREQVDFSIEQAKSFAQELDIPKEKTPRDYQIEAFAHAVQHKRALYILATGGGKSLLIYLCWRYYASKRKRTLIIVPTVGLVNQMYSDFAEYGLLDYDKHVHRISFESGGVKDSMAPVQVSTWQSIQKLPATWFKKFDVLLADEGHQYGAKVFRKIMEKTTGIKYKFAFTGTIDNDKISPLVIEGLFGPQREIQTLASLVDEGSLAELNAKIIILKHTEEKCKLMRKTTIQEEWNYLENLEVRNNFITNLALKNKGKTLILFVSIAHGYLLRDLLVEKNNDLDRTIYLMNGKVAPKVRETYRQSINDSDQDDIIVATYGVFQLGINIPTLKNLIFALPCKSKYRVLQSIGRMTRKNENKKSALLFDVADDLRYKKAKSNHTLRHLTDNRIPYYMSAENNIPYKIYQVNL